MVDFIEICNLCARKTITEAAKRIINSDKVCYSYSNLNFGVTFLEHSVVLGLVGLVALVGLVGLALWLVSGIALNKYRCE